MRVLYSLEPLAILLDDASDSDRWTSNFSATVRSETDRKSLTSDSLESLEIVLEVESDSARLINPGNPRTSLSLAERSDLLAEDHEVLEPEDEAKEPEVEDEAK